MIKTDKNVKLLETCALLTITFITM